MFLHLYINTKNGFNGLNIVRIILPNTFAIGVMIVFLMKPITISITFLIAAITGDITPLIIATNTFLSALIIKSICTIDRAEIIKKYKKYLPNNIVTDDNECSSVLNTQTSLL